MKKGKAFVQVTLRKEFRRRGDNMDPSPTVDNDKVGDTESMVSIAVSLIILLGLIQTLRYLSNLGLFEQLLIEEMQIGQLVVATAEVESEVGDEGARVGVSAVMAEIGTIVGRLGVTDESCADVGDRSLLLQATAAGRRGQLHGAWRWGAVSKPKAGCITHAMHGVILEHGERATTQARDTWAKRLIRWPMVDVRLMPASQALVMRLPERDGPAARLLAWRALRRFRGHLRKRAKRAQRDANSLFVVANADGAGADPTAHTRDHERDAAKSELWLFLSPRRKTVMLALCPPGRYFTASSSGGIGSTANIDGVRQDDKVGFVIGDSENGADVGLRRRTVSTRHDQ